MGSGQVVVDYDHMHIPHILREEALDGGLGVFEAVPDGHDNPITHPRLVCLVASSIIRNTRTRASAKPTAGMCSPKYQRSHTKTITGNTTAIEIRIQAMMRPIT